ncbi:MAG TPA: hypothetical protein VFC70_05315 [Oscillospiraceae bacterium]|nr:hypothetical protein [Oscillospiraceae bacterium]
MTPLSDTTFKGSEGKFAGDITKLIQALGGDKTYNISSPGFLAKSRKTKEKILDEEFKNFSKK